MSKVHNETMFWENEPVATMTEVKKEFIFSNDSLAMYPLLNEIISFLKTHLPSEQYSFKISNCKQILIELLTNAVKHSETDNTVISVCINGMNIEITKSDKGRKFYLNNQTRWSPVSRSLEKMYIGEKIKIYEDDLANLYAVIKNENHIVFEIEDCSISKISRNSNLLEHYGLLIMAKFSNEFFYRYYPETKLNEFTAIINV
ncbi:ATP-binding protein [Pedobacter sp. P351]|uniref:ATP-binding protein n=1 Tax=Pedobacter superstes TaxID=3133441 RepID=UPI0030AB32FD